MKRINLFIVAILAAAVIMLLNFAEVFAQGGISEAVGLKIVIDGKDRVYKDKAIIVNQRTMLPLRELLVDLGVTNDDRHIIWNSKESSVTVIKDGTNIYLREGSTEAKVNGLSVTLDTAPVVYKNKTYIPLRFIAQSLNKKVVWDSQKNTAAICDESSYNLVKSIMEKASQAGRKIARYKVSDEIEYAYDGKSTSKSISTEEIDNEKRIMHEKTESVNLFTNDSNIQYEHYQIGNRSYTKDSSNMNLNTWKKYEYSDASNLFWNYKPSAATVNIPELFCAGAVYRVDEGNGNIILEGDITGPYMMGTISPRELELNSKYYTKITIGKKTGLIMEEIYKRNFTDISGKKAQETRTIKHLDINSEFNIEIPDGLDHAGYESGEVINLPKAQVIINGKYNDYSNTAVMVNGELLLPFKEILADMGFSEAKGDYKWDEKAQTLTVNFDSMDYIAKAGDVNIKTNSSTITIDTAPVAYKSSIYLPLSFFRKCMKKQTVWNEKLSMAVICDMDKYIKNRQIILKANTVMNSVKKYGVTDTSTSYNSKGEIESSLTTNEETDCINKTKHRIHSNRNLSKGVMTEHIFEESYYVDHNSYSRFSRKESQYVKKDVDNGYYGTLYRSFYINLEQWEYAGMTEKTESGSNDIVLEGDVGQGVSSTDQNALFKYHKKITLDKDSYIVKKIEYSICSERGSYPSTHESVITINCLDDNFIIKIPYIAE